jgi:hypothetical protein
MSSAGVEAEFYALTLTALADGQVLVEAVV